MTLLKHIGLFLLARLCRAIIFPIGIIYGLIKDRKGFSEKMIQLAMSDDRYCGAVASELLNDLLLTKDSKHKFGDSKQTISGYLGQNQLDGTLSEKGVMIVEKLDKIDKNHAVDAIGWRKKK